MTEVKNTNPHVAYRNLAKSTRFVGRSGAQGAAGNFASVLDNERDKKTASSRSKTEVSKKEKEEKLNKAKGQALKTQAVTSAVAQQLKPIEVANKSDD